MNMRVRLAALALVLSACTLEMPAPAPQPVLQPVLQPAPLPPSPLAGAPEGFAAVVRRVEPVAEAMCRERLPRGNCDFLIVVDDRPGQPPNAFQTLDRTGRPILGITRALIADARNADELAFVLGHEAGHHIAGHLPAMQQSAMQGALVGGLLGALSGLDQQGTGTLQQLGATVGARRYSMAFELEADTIGTVIAARSGFDPVRGAQFFNRIPNPKNQFLGTHPPNAERMRVVQETAARLGLY
jgi:predicted Zn-dependent protease